MTDKFEQQNYESEKDDFISDKCHECMTYVNDKGECENIYCLTKIK